MDLPLRRALGRPQDVGQHADLRGKVLRITPSWANRGGPRRAWAPPMTSRRATCSRSGRPARVRRSTTWASGSRSHAHRPEEPGHHRCRRVPPRRVHRPSRPPPAGICEWNLVNKAGNFGWPFCAGDKSPANTMTRWNYAANASTGEKYDCSITRSRRHQLRPEGRRRPAPTFQGLARSPNRASRRSGRSRQRRPTRSQRADFGDLSRRAACPITGPIYRYDGCRPAAVASRPTATAPG